MNRKVIAGAIILAALFLLVFCRGEKINNWEIDKPSQPVTQIIFFGDSLTSGFGLKDPETSFPNLVGKHFNIPYKIFGYPGNTTADGLKKIKNLEGENPSLVILTLGGNDILRRLQLQETEKNLNELISHLKSNGHTVVFTEVLPIIAGKRHQIYLKVCKQNKVAMVPNILKGMINNSDSMQGDGIHPNEHGCQTISERVINTLKETELLN